MVSLDMIMVSLWLSLWDVSTFMVLPLSMLLIAVIILVMIGPEERQVDHIKEHAEQIGSEHETGQGDIEKAHGEKEERHSGSTLGLEGSQKLSSPKTSTE
jgi:hypothetical protein